MINGWKIQSANIVISVLSSVTYHKAVKNLKMTETLKDGIKNVGSLFIYFVLSEIRFHIFD